MAAGAHEQGRAAQEGGAGVSESRHDELDEMARQQGVPENPDYAALATAVWETEEEVAAFAEYLRQARQSSKEAQA